jgi:hypothetical protein
MVGGLEAVNNPKNETEIGLDVKELELILWDTKETKQISET